MSEPLRRSTRLSSKRAADLDDDTAIKRASTVAAVPHPACDCPAPRPEPPPSCTGDVSVLALATNSLSIQLAALHTACDDIITSINSMNLRTVTATSRCSSDYDALLFALTRARAGVLREHHTRSHAYDKWLHEKSEEADAVLKQLTAVSAMCAARITTASTLLHSVGHMSMLALRMDGDGARLCMLANIMSPSALAGMSTIWRELPACAASRVHGRLKSFKKGQEGEAHNIMIVFPRVPTGSFAEYVKPDDVHLTLRDYASVIVDAKVSVTVEASSGLLVVNFVVDANCPSKLQASVTVCGIELVVNKAIQSGYDAINGERLVASYDIGVNQGCSQIQINTSETVMMLSFSEEVILMDLYPFIKSCSTTAKLSSELCRCFAPYRGVVTCFEQSEEADIMITYDPTQGRSVSVVLPRSEVPDDDTEPTSVDSITVHGDTVAVCDDGGIIRLFSFSTDAFISMFSCCSWITPSIIRFNADGSEIVVSSSGVCPALAYVYSIEGELLCTLNPSEMLVDDVDEAQQDEHDNGIAFGINGEYIVTDSSNHRICVFSSDGDIIKTWGVKGTGIGEFMHPVSLAVAGSYLYVLDDTSIHVFE